MSVVPLANSPVVNPSALRVWALHLISLATPLYTLAYVTTGPHPGYAAPCWLLVIPAVWMLDRQSGPALHVPVSAAASWPFDAILVVLTLLQLANVALALRLVSQAGLFSAAVPVTILLVGVGSGYSAIVVAHELVHRRGAMALLGRVLLCTVLCDHFSVEHVRGHHARVGTDAEPATARFGESYRSFWRRTVPGQLRSAWRLECKRLGDELMPWNDRRQLGNAVLHGIVAELVLAAAVTMTFGWVALGVFVWQAYIAVRLLEAVNYFEHYGLRRAAKRVQPVDSWDSDSWFTLFALVGLSRHADHHANASRPFQALRACDESPKLPHGYVVTALMAMFANRRLRRAREKALAARKLGPFAESGTQPRPDALAVP